jgi:VanZ family protein
MDASPGLQEFLLMKSNNSLYIKFLWFQFPAILFTILIFLFSAASQPHTPDLGFDMQDKLKHFMAYTFYGFLLGRAFFMQERFPGIRQHYFILAAIFGILYALSDECHQYFVPGRDMSFWDFTADTVGILLGTLLFYIRSHSAKLSSLYSSKSESKFELDR